MAAKFVLEKDAAGRFRYRLISQGRTLLGSSESYTTKRAAQNAIASVRTGAPGAAIDDTTQTTDAGKVRAVKSKAVAKKLESVVAVPRRRGRSTAKSLVAPATKAAKAPAKRTTKAVKRTAKAVKRTTKAARK